MDRPQVRALEPVTLNAWSHVEDRRERLLARDDLRNDHEEALAVGRHIEGHPALDGHGKKRRGSPQHHLRRRLNRSLRRIARDYADAGSVNALIALWGFVDDSVFMTKAGHLGIVYRMAGVSYEGLSHAEQRDLAHCVEAALRLLDERCRLYQYLVKTTVSPFSPAPCREAIPSEAIRRRTDFLNDRRHDLYELSLYFVVLYEPPLPALRSTRLKRVLSSPVESLREWLSTSRVIDLLETDVNRALVTLHQKAQALEVQLSELGPRRLRKEEAFELFRILLNLDPGRGASARLSHDVHLDYFVADCGVDCHRDRLVVGNRQVKVLSMKEPPSQTFALMLRDLYAVPGEFIACLEWQRIPHDRMRRDIQTRKRHFFNKRVALLNYVSPESSAQEMLVDDSATATVHRLGDALTELEVHGHFFGACSLTLVLHGHDAQIVEHQAAEAMKAMAVHDGALFDETYNLLNAWIATVPGNGRYNLRRLALLETNLADLSFVFTLDQGDKDSVHLGREALAVFETPHAVPYSFNLHVDDVGHTLVLGATGSGKSFLINFLLTHAQKYDPLTVVLDIGASYRKLAMLLRGGHVEIGRASTDTTINPFALDGTAEHFHFLHAFVRVLLEGTDGCRLSDAEDREVYDAVENVYALDRAQRRLFTLANMIPRPLGQRLQKWIEGGRYGRLFDNTEDTVSLQRLQVFDFESMAAYPELLEPLLFYLLHRIAQRIAEAKLLQRVLQPAAVEVGLGRLTWHQFRHIHSSLLNDLRVPAKIAQEQLGHASISTTLGIYTHVVDASHRSAVEALEERLFVETVSNCLESAGSLETAIPVSNSVN